MVKLPINILLVDDERDFVEMLSLRLTEAGHRVRTAFSGQEALAVLAEYEGVAILPEIDVIILDIKMPGMDGIETLKQIKTRYPVVEIILLTGHGAVDTREQDDALVGPRLQHLDGHESCGLRRAVGQDDARG